MTTVLVASDLDRTLIYSQTARRLGDDDAKSVCVEIYEGRPVSFMTAAAADELAAMMARVTFVPVTTRIVEQYDRVTLPGPRPRYAVVANGGVLLVDGVPDRDWARLVRATTSVGAPLDEVWTHVAGACHPSFTSKLRNAADLFCYAVVRPERLPDDFLPEITAWAAERGWRTSMQGRKVYWVPDGLTKGAALRAVAERVEADLVLAAGDSLLDIDLLLAADRGIRPAHGELHDQGWTAAHITSTEATGIEAGAEIVNWFSGVAASAVRQ